MGTFQFSFGSSSRASHNGYKQPKWLTITLPVVFAAIGASIFASAIISPSFVLATLALSFVFGALVVTGVILAIVKAMKQRNTPAVQQSVLPATPPTSSTPVDLAAEARVQRAKTSGNYGVGRKVGNKGLLMFAGLSCAFGLMWLITQFAVSFALPAMGLYMVIFFYVFIRMSKGSGGKQIKRYRDIYRNNGVDGSSVIAERMQSERVWGNEQDQGGADTSKWTASLMDYLGVESPSDQWNISMWKLRGEALLGRELTLANWASQRGLELDPFLISGEGVEPLNQLILTGEGELWQVRNVINIPDSGGTGYTVRFGDLNRLTRVTMNDSPHPGLRPGSFAETWFPSDHVLVAYPDAKFGAEWRAAGAVVDTGEAAFEKVFDVRSDNPAWARLVMNPSVMMTLIELSPLVLVIDAGRITISLPDRWAEPEEIDALTQAVQDVARSARAAEA